MGQTQLVSILERRRKNDDDDGDER